jgi:hypothetical protein
MFAVAAFILTLSISPQPSAQEAPLTPPKEHKLPLPKPVAVFSKPDRPFDPTKRAKRLKDRPQKKMRNTGRR